MWITCYADASFHRGRGGSWGVWLTGPGGRLVRSGKCPRFVRTSHDAELAAIYAAMTLALRHWGGAVQGLAVRSDCKGALEQADPASRFSRRDGTRRLQKRIRELVSGSGVQVELSWVRGHQPLSAGPAAWLNRQVDRLARTHASADQV